MREVLLGQGAASHLDLRARSVHILSVLAGSILAALVGCAVRGGIDWLETDNIWFTSSVFVFFLPVALPGAEQQSVVTSVMCLTGVSMVIGPYMTAKVLMLGLGGYHGHVAHGDFDAWLSSAPASRRSSEGPLSPAESKNALLAANMPFFRLGASMGLGAAGIIDPRALLITSLIALTAGLCIASILFRKWTSEKAAEDAEREASAAGTEPWARTLGEDGETEVSRAMRRLSDGRARRTGGSLSNRGTSRTGGADAARRDTALDAVQEAEEDNEDGPAVTSTTRVRRGGREKQKES